MLKHPYHLNQDTCICKFPIYSMLTTRVCAAPGCRCTGYGFQALLSRTAGLEKTRRFRSGTGQNRVSSLGEFRIKSFALGRILKQKSDNFRHFSRVCNIFCIFAISLHKNLFIVEVYCLCCLFLVGYSLSSLLITILSQTFHLLRKLTRCEKKAFISEKFNSCSRNTFKYWLEYVLS